MWIPVIVLSAAILMIAVEVAHPARPWPRVAGWWLRAALLNGVQIAAVFLAGWLWDPWMREHHPWSVATWPVAVQALVGYIAITFIYYWWHRWRHEVTFLWQWVHQVHHSPQRIEVLTSFYKHPIEIVVNSVLSSAILYLLVGVTPQAAAYAVLLTGLAELFYHWNVPTPRWLGYFFQRPEMHCVHHEHGHHRQNFSDLPLWDMLFGTYHNPVAWRVEDGKACGLGSEEHRLLAMLRGVNVGSGLAEEASQAKPADVMRGGTSATVCHERNEP